MTVNQKRLVQWTEEKLVKFKVAYKAAVDSKADYFMFDKHEFLTSYAKYLIEHLTEVFKAKRRSSE